MKVSELIEKLKQFDPDSLVVVGGLDEEGYADIHRVQAVSIKLRESESAREFIGEYEHTQTNEMTAVLVDH